jgi:type II secretory pathway component GspD/PulD (secretin)
MNKIKMLAVTLLAGFVLHPSALCQTAASETTTNPAATSPVMAEGSNQPVSFATSNAATASPGESNAPAVVAASNEPAASVSMSNAPAMAGLTNTPVSAAAEAGTNMAAVELPIQLQDVPITTAIESLTRLAGINYLLDPKIGYGQPDANGQIKPEPTLSIRWENVTARQALMALLDNYGLELVENPKTKIYKVTTKEPNALPPLITRVIQLKFSSTSNIMAAVESTLVDKRSKVVPDARTSQLVIVATEPEQANVDTLIGQLDKPTRQVLIETHLVELSSNPSTTKGIDWSGTLQAQNVSFGNGVLNGGTPSASTTTIPGTPVTTPGLPLPSGGSTASTTTTPSSTTATILNSMPQNSLSPGGLTLNTLSGLTPGIGFLSADGAKAVLSFLNQSSEAQVVSTPRVVTLDNETATISVTRAFPIMNVSAGTANTAGGSSITYSNLGTILIVTPRISANDYIWLKVTPTVSSYFGQDSQTINGVLNTADIFDLRSVDTQVLIPNAHTLVMGGLVKDNPNSKYTKVPILGDIPFLGVAFRSENKSMEKDNLLIFITPTIVKDTDFKPMTSDFLNSTPRTMKDSMNMHTWLDSAQPRGEWSNPLTADKGDLNPNSVEEKTIPAP